MADVIWSPESLRDVADVLRIIERTSAIYARSFALVVDAAARLLGSQPRLGAKVPEYELDDVREWIIRSCRLIYRLRDENVESSRS